MRTHVRSDERTGQCKVFRFRLRPTAAQEAALLRYAAARRFAYNWALERWCAEYRETGRRIPTRVLWREITALKQDPSYAWLREVDSQLLQQAIIDVQRAFRAFFERRARFPRFASRKRGPERFRIPQRVRVVGDRVYVPKIGWIRLRLSQDVDRPTRSATFKRDATGRWFVTLVADVGELPEPRSEIAQCSTVGLDLGVIDLVVASDGTRVAAPRHHRRADRKLRRARRRSPASNEEAGAGSAHGTLSRAPSERWPTAEPTSCISSAPRSSGASTSSVSRISASAASREPSWAATFTTPRWESFAAS
jgi:putative transposase